MAVTVAVLIPAKQAENSQTTQFTVGSGQKAIIDKFTVTNSTGTAATLAINLVTNGGSPGASNLVLDDKSIEPGETYFCPEAVGHALGTGDFISTLADTASALTIRASGRVVT